MAQSDRSRLAEDPYPTVAAEELRLSEERFRLLVSSVRDYAIFMLDPDGRVSSWNEGAQRIKGYTAADIIGRHFSQFYPPEDLEAGKPAMELEVALAEGRFEDEGWRVRKDGTMFWANVIITALFDSEGQHVGFAKVTRDLTERRRAEVERLQLAQEQAGRAAAEAALKVREEFLSAAAHELKTPITSLRMFAQLATRQLERTGEVDADLVARTLRGIDQHSAKLASLVDQLLDIARFENGRLSINRQEADLVEIVRGVVDRARPTTTHHVLSVSAPPSVPWPVDALRIEQVVTNLVNNAIKYSPVGGDVRVEINPLPAGEVEVAVVDQGIGVAPEHREHIFERFYQVSTSDYYAGMGLGLYISHEIVELHGGTLRAEYPAAGGSRFIVTLPAH
ncbi:MAG: hypothetical protein QOF51_3937 [Chloroflexota bacterium]|jgi:PAS domain S-box-containing protein|nr:hypothetical protein [Chloroflexota bacterium]